MLLKEILQVGEYIVNKEQSTNVISLPQFNLNIPVKLKQLLKLRKDKYLALSEWERAQMIDLMFSFLKKQTTLNIVNGFAAFPDDYYLTDGITYTQTKTINNVQKVKVRKVDECSGSEFANRQTVTLESPTEEHPISQIIGNNIQVLPSPLQNPNINFQYIRNPKVPYLDWYVDQNKNIVYRDQGEGASSTLIGSQEVTSITLTGITNSNSDSGRLYWELTNVGTISTLTFYKDSSRTLLVCEGAVTASGTMTLTQRNSSGISGTAQITIRDYLTLSGDTYSMITSITMSGVEDIETFGWDIRIKTFDSGITTFVTIYSDQTYKNIIYQYHFSGTDDTRDISFRYKTFSISAHVVMTGTLQVTITKDSPGSLSSVSNFKVSTPVIYNSNTFYYTYTEVLGVRTISIYSDSGHTVLLMSATTSDMSLATFTLPLVAQNNSGYSGFITINAPHEYLIVGDSVSTYTIYADTLNELRNFKLNGVDNTNSDNGTLYYDVQDNHSGGYVVNLFRDSAKAHLVAYGIIPNTSVSWTTVILSGHGLSTIQGWVELNYDGDETGSTQRIVPDTTASQLSNVLLNGVNSSNSNAGVLYWSIGNQGIGGYTVNIYKDSAHNFAVASGNIPGTTGIITLTSTKGISGSVQLNYLQDNSSSLNAFTPVDNNDQSGQITYISGNKSDTNSIEIYTEQDPGNVFINLTPSLTQEIELRDEDTLDVLWLFLKDIGTNISREDVIKYANETLK